MNLPLSIINIKSEEKKPAVLLFLMFFAIVSAGIIGTTCRDTIFLTQFNRSYLPLMFVAIAVFMAGFITLYKYIIARHDQILIITLSGLFFTLSLVFFQANLSGLFIPALYIWIENLQPWKSTIAIQYLIKSENTSALKKINWSELPNSLFEKNIFNRIEQDYLNRNYLNRNLSGRILPTYGK